MSRVFFIITESEFPAKSPMAKILLKKVFNDFS